MREKLLLLWVIAESSGKVLACHCNCKAELGEACSHVASLWTVEAGVRLREYACETVKRLTGSYPLQLKNYFMLLSVNSLGRCGALRTLPITISCDFTTTYNCTNHTINSYDVTCNFTTFPTLQHFPIPSSGEVGHLFASLSTCSTKPAILALLVDYSSNYIPSSLARGLPTCLSDML